MNPSEIRDGGPTVTRPSWLPERLFPFDSRLVEIDGHHIHYVDEGTGPLVLFLHGNPDYSLLYRHQIGALRGRYRCIALDLPGFGLSEADDSFGFTPDEQATVVEAFIRQLDLRHAVLVVHDWGGPIGLRAAAQTPERFVGLAITATLAWPDYRKQVPWWLRLMMGYLGSERGRRLTVNNNLMVEGPLRSEMTKGTHPPNDAVKAAYRGPFPTAASRLPSWVLAHHLFTAAGESFLSAVERDLAKLQTLPSLLIFGGADTSTRATEELPRFERAFPNHRSVVIPGAGHFLHESAPDQTTSALRDWLDQLVSSHPFSA